MEIKKNNGYLYCILDKLYLKINLNEKKIRILL